ncbi:MAG TPA: hypothetical protein VHV83_11265 [Armatimonadota bacterium]|nr:hypothetical protein [Armatimonadota bacterium]
MHKLSLLLVLNVLLLQLAMSPSTATTWQAIVAPQSGSLQLSYAGRPLDVLEPGMWAAEWQGVNLSVAAPVPGSPSGTYQGQLVTSNGGTVTVTTTITPVTGGVHLHYRFVPQQAIALNSLHVNLSLPAPRLVGGTFLADGTAVTLPRTFHDVTLYSRPTRDLSLTLPDQSRLDFRFATPTPVLLQDDRQWGNTCSLRIGPQANPSIIYPAGVPYIIDLTLTSPAGIAFAEDHPVTLTANENWIPMAPTSQDIVAGSALDFSRLFPQAPAGKFGRVIATRDGQFAFADRPSVPVRFYGVNLVGMAQYLSHAESDRFAERLQRLGYNAVRLHHYDGPLIENNRQDSVHLNPATLDQLDYLVAALKQRGIYITTDLYVSRPVLASEVWPGETGNVGQDEFKMAVPVNERAYANFLAFTTALLTHVNPYTHLRWADDPAVAWLSMINEGNEGNFIGDLTPRVKADWAHAWQTWLAANSPTVGTLSLPVRLDDTPEGKLLSRFLADTDAHFVAKTKEYLRQTLGCQALLTNLNAWTNPLQAAGERQAFDFVDDHFYVGHPTFLGPLWQLPARSVITSPISDGAAGGRYCAFTRLRDKPFVVTEFNYGAPAPYRAVGGLLTATLAATQNWSALWRFAYSHTRDGVIAPRPLDFFNVGADPLNQASDRAALLLFRRGDVRTAPHALSVVFTPEDLHGAKMTTRPVPSGWNALALVTQVGAQQAVTSTTPIRAKLALPLSGTIPAKRGNTAWLPIDPYAPDAATRILAAMHTRGWLTAANRTDPTRGIWQSETNEVTVDIPGNTYTVDTPRTIGGFVPAGKRLTTPAATITVEGTDATVMVTSLDGRPIAKSRHLLLCHLTEVQNTGATFADTQRSVVTAWGNLPYLVKEGRATVTLRLAHPERARVWGLATDGARLAPLDTRREPGALVIPLEVNAQGSARIYYEVIMTP